MPHLRKALTIAGATLAITAPLIATGSPAFAAARDGVCDGGEFCYYWGLYQTDSVSDFNGAVGNYGTTQPTCFDFKGAGSGKGECIKNNAMSVWNHSSITVRVYFNSNFSGTKYQDIAPFAKVNLNSTLLLNNASHKFL